MHAAGVDGDDHCLRSEALGDAGDQRRIGDRGGVDGDLVGAGVEDRAGIVERTNSSAHRERHEELARGAANCLDQRLALLMRGGDVEQDNFVGAVGGVQGSQFGGIACIADVHELHAFDDASGVAVETGNDALGQHRVDLP